MSSRPKNRHALTLMRAIAAGTLPTGAWLTENDVVTDFEISRGASREVIHTLELCGAVVVHHGKGALVHAPHAWNPFVALVIQARIESPGGEAVAMQYLMYARYYLMIVSMSVVERGEQTVLTVVDDALRRFEHPSAADAVASGATIDAHVLRAWGEGPDDPVRTRAAETFAQAIETTARQIPRLAGDRNLNLLIHRTIHTAAADRNQATLLAMLQLLVTQPS